jgi:hypothetical protein
MLPLQNIGWHNLLVTGWTSDEPGFDFLQETDFSSTVQTGSGAQMVSYENGIRTVSPGVKEPRREAHHSALRSA